jgi:hypothetical protein
VTVTFIPNTNRTPVVWLVKGACVINGTVDVSGGDKTSDSTNQEPSSVGTILIAALGKFVLNGVVRSEAGVGVDYFDTSRAGSVAPRIVISKLSRPGRSMPGSINMGRISTEAHPYAELRALGVSYSDVFEAQQGLPPRGPKNWSDKLLDRMDRW